MERRGPDIVSNGLALSGPAHWMFDRDGAEGLINRTGKLIGPVAARDRPHPAFLGWQRQEVFKG